ncbi:MAG: hypothetical protein HZY75_00280 [Nocardioidaceae bacterium]|nr:MAG: hypothetical protein HZY75_00280 [Nocardioidaceae bacterium]
MPSGTTDLSGDGDAESAEATLRAADDTAASAAEIAADAKGNATAWLDLLTDLSSSGEVLALPYGDVDVEGAYQAEFGELVAQASERGVQVLADHDIESIPVLAPTEGSLTGLTTTASARVAPVLMAADQVETTGSRVNTAAGAQITLTDQSLALPVSKDQLTTLAVRQRVLATAAVRALDDAANGPW